MRFCPTKSSGRKVTLADYSLTPDVAIVDPQFVMSMPKGLTADTGIDCLTHALEAAVSIYASPYTDSNAMQAIRLVFKYLPISYAHPHDEEARSMMHNAACIAAIAFSNAAVGVNHALAHAFGARFGVATAAPTRSCCRTSLLITRRCLAVLPRVVRLPRRPHRRRRLNPGGGSTTSGSSAGLSQLALQVDKWVNNTSLAVAFESPTAERWSSPETPSSGTGSRGRPEISGRGRPPATLHDQANYSTGPRSTRWATMAVTTPPAPPASTR